MQGQSEDLPLPITGAPGVHLGWLGYLLGLLPVLVLSFVLTGLLTTLGYPLPLQNISADIAANPVDAVQSTVYMTVAAVLLTAPWLTSASRVLTGSYRRGMTLMLRLQAISLKRRQRAAVQKYEKQRQATNGNNSKTYIGSIHVPSPDADTETIRYVNSIDWRLNEGYPSVLRPTALGNAAAAARERIWHRYGCDVEVLWPRLGALLLHSEQGFVRSAERRRDLTIAIATGLVLSEVWLLLTVAAYWQTEGIRLLLVFAAIALYIMARRAYAGAFGATVEYGRALEIAFDLYRERLLAHMGNPAIAAASDQRKHFMELSLALAYGGRLPKSWGEPKRTVTGGLVDAEERLAGVFDRALDKLSPAIQQSIGAAVPAAINLSLQEALSGPTLCKYDGWVSVLLLRADETVTITKDRRAHVEAQTEYELVTYLGPRQEIGLSEPIRITDGIDCRSVSFGVELDSDDPDLRKPRISIDTRHGELEQASFRFTTPASDRASPWLWLRVSQHSRTIQSIELSLTISNSPSR